MFEIPDAPWIREVERTGHYKYGYWNNYPADDDDDGRDDEDDDDGYEVIDRI